MNEDTKGIRASIEADFNPRNIEQGAKAAETALSSLRQNVADLQRTFEALNRTPKIFEMQRGEFEQKHGKKSGQEYGFSEEAEKAKIEALRQNFSQYANAVGQQLREHPELGQTSIAQQYEKLAEQGAPLFVSRPQLPQAGTPQLSTERLGQIIGEKFSQSPAMSRKERQELYQEVQPFIHTYQSRLEGEKRSASAGVLGATAEFERLSPAQQNQRLDDYTTRIRTLEESLRKTVKTQGEFNTSLKDFTDQAGMTSSHLPSYVGTVVNMAGAIATGVANIHRAEALAFDYGSPIGMYSAQEQLDIFKTQQYMSSGGRLIGSLAGGAIGSATGIGALAGSYLGGQIVGEVGDALGTYITTDPSRALKMTSQMYGKRQQMTGVLASIQEGTYGVARRSGVDPEKIMRIVSKYPDLGLDPMQASQLAQQYISATGNFDEGGFDQWLQFQARTGLLPQGAGLFEKLTGRSGVSTITSLGAQMNLSNPRYADLLQSFQTNTSIAGRTFLDPSNIQRATTLLSGLPAATFGNNIPEGMKTFEQQQQLTQGYMAFGTPKSEAERAFLFRALRKPDDSFTKTMLRMDEGILGQGNLGNILGSIPQGKNSEAYIYSLLSGKGVSPDVIRTIIQQFQGDRGGLLQRLEGAEGMQGIQSALGGAVVSPLTRIQAQQTTTTAGLAQKFAESFAQGLADFNIQVAKMSTSPAVSKEIERMFIEVTRSIGEAYHEMLSEATERDSETGALMRSLSGRRQAGLTPEQFKTGAQPIKAIPVHITTDGGDIVPIDTENGSINLKVLSTISVHSVAKRPAPSSAVPMKAH